MGQWFHTRVREARRLSGLSQADSGRKLGVSGPTISNWEGRVSEPWNEQRAHVLARLGRMQIRATKGARPKRRSSPVTAASGRDSEVRTPGEAARRQCSVHASLQVSRRTGPT
jgi:transcriptional regulator with XRE-family HTH domain